MERVSIAEYDVYLRMWTSRYKFCGNPSVDYLDYVMRNKWIPGANYSRAVYRQAKEHIARGFIRELMERVHTLGFDINIHTG